MTIIKQADLIQSIANAFQFISYYHSKDFIDAMAAAWEKEKSPAAKDALAQIIHNSRLSAENKRPICQDTGIAVVFVEVGMQVQWDSDLDLEAMINEAVSKAYLHPDNTLRASVLSDPAGKRQNTKDNTPAVIHTKIVAGDKVHIKLAAKGGGSENKAKFAKVNTEEEPELSEQFNITGIPCIIIVKDGKEVGRVVGFAPKDAMKEKIDAVLDSI